jgi:predicted dehydrogenase
MKDLLTLEMDKPFIANGQTLAVIGFSGFNAQKRVIPELARLNGRFNLVGFDLNPPAEGNGIPCVLVRDTNDLLRRLKEQRPDVVIIETPCDLHPTHIRLALESGAPLVICEKCVGIGVSRVADELMPAVRAARPQQEVFIVDHYLWLDLVMTLHANAARWLGDVKRMEVTLFEGQGVPPHQERSHADGMTNFFHHVIALASLFLDLTDLAPVQAAWAKHPDAKVPDTYRAARFKSQRTGEVVLTGAVGKYMAAPRKLIRVEGARGVAVLDREENNLMVVGEGGLSVDGRRDPDSGYGELVNALANGEILRPDFRDDRCAQSDRAAARQDRGNAPLPLLTVEQALRVLRLVERAHAIAAELPLYPDGQDVVFGDSAR